LGGNPTKTGTLSIYLVQTPNPWWTRKHFGENWNYPFSQATPVGKLKFVKAPTLTRARPINFPQVDIYRFGSGWKPLEPNPWEKPPKGGKKKVGDTPKQPAARLLSHLMGAIPGAEKQRGNKVAPTRAKGQTNHRPKAFSASNVWGTKIIKVVGGEFGGQGLLQPFHFPIQASDSQKDGHAPKKGEKSHGTPKVTRGAQKITFPRDGKGRGDEKTGRKIVEVGTFSNV